MNKIAIRVDGNSKVGMGHITTSLALAKELINTGNFEILFIMKEYVQKVIDKGYTTNILKKNKSEPKEILEILDNNKIDLIIFDMLEINYNLSEELKKRNIKNILIDISGIYEGKIIHNADIIINRTIVDKRFEKYNYTKSTFYLGPNFFFLDEQFIISNKEKRKINKIPKKIMITFGGSDQKNIITKILNYLNNQKINQEIIVVIGPFYQEKIYEENYPNIDIKIIKNVKNMAKFMMESDLTISSGGLTAFELAASGTPSLIITSNQHEVDQATALNERGSTIYLGDYQDVNEEKFMKVFNQVINNFSLRKNMSLAGKNILDGKGAKRVAQIIENLF